MKRFAHFERQFIMFLGVVIVGVSPVIAKFAQWAISVGVPLSFVTLVSGLLAPTAILIGAREVYYWLWKWLPWTKSSYIAEKWGTLAVNGEGPIKCVLSNGAAVLKQRGPWADLQAETNLCRSVSSEYVHAADRF